jgi:hypothetical protein
VYPDIIDEGSRKGKGRVLRKGAKVVAQVRLLPCPPPYNDLAGTARLRVISLGRRYPMGLFWEHFNSDDRARCQVISDLRESLGELCEGFALDDTLPRWQRRQTLLTELKKLADYYRRSENWGDVP